MPPLPRPACATLGRLRLRQRWVWAWLTLWLALLPTLAPAQGCSPYLGQASINELRIGKSNSSDAKNQIEVFNSGSVPQAVWSTWQLVVYFKSAGGSAVKKGGYYLSTNTVASGSFILTNRSKKIFLRNKAGEFVDVALLDGNGNFIDYLALEGRIQSVPACLGTPVVVNVSAAGDVAGNVSRLPNGGSLPASVTNSANHTIGATNVCTPGASDLFISHNANITTPVATKTTIAYTTSVTNLSCSNTVAGIAVTVTGISDANPGGFSGLAKNISQGSTTSVNDSPMVWTVGTLAPGATATMTVTGKPRTVGTVNSLAAITAPASGLANTGNDSEAETVAVQAWNWVGFQLAADTVTEGQITHYSALITAAVIPSNTITVYYSVSGSSNAGDTNLAASGSVLIDPNDPNQPDSTAIDFSITDDLIAEPTKTLTLTITSVSSGDSMVRFDSGSTLFTPSMTITLLDDDAPDHYELALPTSGLSCQASTVTVTACGGSAKPCNTPFTRVAGLTATLAASAGTLGATSVVFDANGVATTTLSHPGASNGSVVTVTLSGEQRVSFNPRQCCPNGAGCSAANSCSITIDSAGLIIAAAANGSTTTVPTQTAGSASAGLQLRAVRTNTSTQACEAALVGAQSVNWAYQCLNPASCSASNLMQINGGVATTVQRNPASGVTAYTAVPMTFDANGNAAFSFSFQDVGQARLWASTTVNGAPLSGSSNAFVTRPAGLVLGAVAQTAGPNRANPAAVSAAGAAFVKAGEAFAATVTATTSSGAAAPNFGKETSPEGVLLTPALVLPAGGASGSLSNGSIAGASFSNGVATLSNLAWSEVGILSLTPSLADGDYLGSGPVTGTPSGNIGRFIPDHFALTAGSASPACSGVFSYFGQDGFSTSFTLRAESLGNSPTQNYTGAFAKLDATSWSALGFSASGLPAGSSLLASASATSGAWAAGLASITARHQASRPASPVAEATVTVRAAPVDADGVALASTAVASPSLLRYGRLRLSNAFGSARAALQLPVLAEYWSGGSWVLNSADSCTSVPAASVALSNPRTATGAASLASSSAGAISLASGSGLLTLAAPSPAGSSLTLDLALNLGSSGSDQSCNASHPASSGAAKPWLRALNGSCAATTDRDPAARASFGVYSAESRKTVHVREIY